MYSLDICLPAGRATAFLGRNGAGKTTTIKMLAGLIRPSSRSASLFGRDSRSLRPEDWQKIGYVSENQELYDWMTGEQLIAFTSALYPSWDRAFERELIEKLELPLQRRISRCSRGEKVKLALLLATWILAAAILWFPIVPLEQRAEQAQWLMLFRYGGWAMLAFTTARLVLLDAPVRDTAFFRTLPVSSNTWFGSKLLSALVIHHSDGPRRMRDDPASRPAPGIFRSVSHLRRGIARAISCRGGRHGHGREEAFVIFVLCQCYALGRRVIRRAVRLYEPLRVAQPKS